MEDGAGNGLWISAGQQTDGRGRRGREWVSKHGNLYCSLIYDSKEDVRTASQLSFVTSLAVRDAVGEFLNIDQIKCKWPNDILVKGKKISGILLETYSRSANSSIFMIIGIGINIKHHPEIALYDATDINEQTDDEFEAIDVFNALSHKMAYWLKVWHDQDFAKIRKEWLKCCKGLGEMVTVKLPNEQLNGRFIGLDDDGALKLDINGEIKLIYSGDVFFND